MGELDTLFKQYKFPVRLYSEIRNNFRHNLLADKQKEASFVESLPLTFKQRIAYYIYAPMRDHVNWLKGKKENFLAWICPLLWPCSYCPNELVYYEAD